MSESDEDFDTDGEPNQKKQLTPSVSVNIFTLLAIFFLVAALAYYVWTTGQENRPTPADEQDQRGRKKKDTKKCKSKTSGGAREEYCRQIFEDIFGVRFETTRALTVLKNPRTGRPLELDGYNRSLRLAFEHDGRQHFEPGHFGMTQSDLNALQYRDVVKDQITASVGIDLIRIKYDVPRRHIRQHIIDNLPPRLAFFV